MTLVGNIGVASKQVAIVGFGKSGQAAAGLCLRQGAQVVAYDQSSKGEAAAEALGIDLVVGDFDANALCRSDLVVVSPGVPANAALEQTEKAREVIGELELASRGIDCDVALVGGTNGKSTVTALLAEMAKVAGRKAFVGGNFGTPLSDAVGGGHDLAIVEISSFQAERVPTLHAKVHALLNVSEDHLDRYPSYAAYADAKGNPFCNMVAEDAAVVPAGDSMCMTQAQRGAARIVNFGENADVRITQDAIADHRSGEVYALNEIKLRGRHNLLNACAAIAAAKELAIPSHAIRQALAQFGGLPHRHCLVAEIDGVRFYDDSKATNVGAAVAALSGLDEAYAILIAGGRDKHGSYEPLAKVLRRRARAVVLIGEAADRMAAAFQEFPVHRSNSMNAAVQLAAELAQSGDAVLLSPACSSFDMYRSFAARGDDFVAAVRGLEASA